METHPVGPGREPRRSREDARTFEHLQARLPRIRMSHAAAAELGPSRYRSRDPRNINQDVRDHEPARGGNPLCFWLSALSARFSRLRARWPARVREDAHAQRRRRQRNVDLHHPGRHRPHDACDAHEQRCYGQRNRDVQRLRRTEDAEDVQRGHGHDVHRRHDVLRSHVDDTRQAGSHFPAALARRLAHDQATIAPIPSPGARRIASLALARRLRRSAAC